MYSKGILGIAGVALIGTLATNVAHATFTLNDDGEVQGALNVPRETLVEADSMMKDGVKYYRVKQSDNANELDLRMEAGVARAAGQQLRLIITLDGALLAQNVNIATTGNTILRTYDNAGTEISRAGANSITVTRLEGGMKGDDNVTLGIVTAGSAALTTDSEFLFEPRELLVDPDRPVSITIRPTYTFAGVPVGSSVPFPRVITVVDGVNVTSALPAENPVASVTDDFTKFKGPDDGGDPVLTAHLGQFEVKVATTTNLHLAVTASGVAGATISQDELEKMVSSTEVTLAGDTSFLGENGDIYLTRGSGSGATRNNCDPAGKMSFLQTGENMTRSVDEVTLDWGTAASGARHLCISVPEEDGMPIPATDAYTLTLAHTMAVTGIAAEFRRDNDALTMGRITRDGTSMYVPWLTTDDRYNQRIVLWNRSSRAANYALTFTTEDGVTATAGDDATGTLAANSRTVLSMRNDDVVTLAGGNRTSATIMVVAPSGLVEASTVTLNRQDGSTDTVVYSSQ